MSLETRLAQLILTGQDFSADDVTQGGKFALDAAHRANAGQNGIGTLFRTAAGSGRIDFTGQVVRSKAPHRKGGAIRVWRGTADGEQWARTILQSTSTTSSES